MEEKHFGPIWFIPGENRGIYPFCNSVYIEGPGILIDPASDRKRLAQLKEDPGVNQIWLSHWHEDHFLYLNLFKEVPVYISEKDSTPLSNLDIFMDAYGVGSDEERETWRSFLADQLHIELRKPTAFLKSGETSHLNGVTVEKISTPGHTPGHLAFFFKEQELLFMGDYDLTRFGPWYADVESSIEDTVASVERLKKIPAKTWITGHETGLYEEEPEELWDRYLNVIDVREGKLLDFLKEPRTMEEITGAWIVYGRPMEPKAFYEFGERAHMKKHLERLMKQGVVVMEENRYRRV